MLVLTLNVLARVWHRPAGQVVTLNFWISVEFDDLWKFHAPVNTVEGFNVSLFDKLIEVKRNCQLIFWSGKMACTARFLVCSYIKLLSFRDQSWEMKKLIMKQATASRWSHIICGNIPVVLLRRNLRSWNLILLQIYQARKWRVKEMLSWKGNYNSGTLLIQSPMDHKNLAFLTGWPN